MSNFAMLILVLLLCAGGLLSPILIDAHHWWPRERKTKRPEN